MSPKSGSDLLRVAFGLMVILLLRFGAAAQLLLDTAGVANYNHWVMANRDTLPALRPVWATVEEPSPSAQDSHPICHIRFWHEDGNLRRSVELRCCDGAFLVGPYVIAWYCGDESCLVYDSTGRKYLRQTPDSTVVWGAKGRLCFGGWYQPCLGDPTILVLTVGGMPVGDTVVVIGRDGSVINRVPNERKLYVSGADVYRSPSGTSVLAMSEFVALDRKGNVLWRKPRGCHEDIYLSADGSTFARVLYDSAASALVAYDRSGATIARIGIATKYPEELRLSAHGRFAALYGGRTATLVSIAEQRVLWQFALPDAGEAQILDVRPDTVVVAFAHEDPSIVRILADGHEPGQPIRLRRELNSYWQCSVAGDLLVARRGDRFRVYALWR